jgi:lysylphosphatidylglycerol synthetase-like protein (DUF2156 family)
VNALRPLDRDPISRSTRQRALSTFVHPRGSVAFTTARGVTLTLGAPSCAPQFQAEVARAFVAEHPDAAFFYVTEAQRQQLGLESHHALPIGTEYVLPLPLAAAPKLARTALRKATRQGLTLDEPADLTPLAAELRRVHEAYLSAREVKTELHFLNRPCEFERERDARTFVLRQRGQVIGFVVLDVWEDERGRGALLNMFRLAPTRLWNVYQAVVLLLGEQLTRDGFTQLSLGFVPLTPLSERVPLLQRLQHAALRWLASRSTYLQRLGVIKHGFQARAVTRWLVTPRALVLRDLRAFLEAMDPAAQKALT